jgi:hypothetical protein
VLSVVSYFFPFFHKTFETTCLVIALGFFLNGTSILKNHPKITSTKSQSRELSDYVLFVPESFVGWDLMLTKLICFQEGVS